MVLVRLLGGLGNQLFQVAFAHRLVQEGFQSVTLDTSAFRDSRSDTPRHLEIDPAATDFRMRALARPIELLARRVREPLHVHEAGFGDDVLSRITPRTRMVTGYFQSWHLAESAAHPMTRLISQHIRPSAAPTPFVALHARLGDYLSNPSTLAYHGATSPAWLVRVARGLRDELGVEQIRVFTDSPQHFRVLAEADGLDDLVFDHSQTAWGVISDMQHASGFVISNSSLSWWAVFASHYVLGAHAPVIAPMPWFANPSAADTLMLGPNWRPMQREVVPAEQARELISRPARTRPLPSGSVHRSELLVCTRNRVEDLRKCLHSVFGTVAPPERVLVVDSSDDDRTEKLVAELSPVSPVDLDYLRGPIGLTLQRNLGLEQLRATTEIVHFLDDDVVLEPEYFVAIDAVFAGDPSIAGVGGKITDAPPTEPSRLRALLFLSGPQGAVLRSGHNIMTTDYVDDTDVEWLSGCSMSYRKQLIAGLQFDVRRAGYGLGEDVDFSMRARTRGRLVWTPRARLEHHQGDRGPDYYFKMSRASVRNRWMLASDRLGRVRRWAVVYATLAWAAKGLAAAVARGDVRLARKYRAGIDGLVDLLGDRRERRAPRGG